ncbi:MAG: LytTR family transcriptional regulator [Clostridia bacterium]|nr:LytTR family transcriptional regulator [Clostridia bacterium]
MEYKLIIDKEKEESLILTVNERNELVEKIEELVGMKADIIHAYKDNEIFRISSGEADCFFTDNNKIYAYVGKDKYSIKLRLYQLEEILNDDFMKINRGCLVNVKKIRKFEMSFGGTISVVLTNGFSDYISRRELKNVKRRMGL